MNSMTKAFTLIEVLVSVMILSVVGTGLLQISSNSKQNFAFLKEKSEFDRLASIAFIHNDKKYHHKDMTLFDFLRDDYTQINDDLRKYLKEVKVSYSHEEVSSFAPFEQSIDEQNLSNENPEEELLKNSLNITILYDKISISKKNSATYAYKVYIP